LAAAHRLQILRPARYGDNERGVRGPLLGGGCTKLPEQDSGCAGTEGVWLAVPAARPERGKIRRAVGLTASIRPRPLAGRHMTVAPLGLRRTIGVAIVAAAVATSLGTAASEHTELRGLWIAGSAAITWGFLGVGLFVWARRPDNRVGPLMVAVAFSWVVSDLVFANSDLLFSLGSMLSQVFIAVTVHLLLVFPTGHFESRLDRLTAAAAYFAAGVLYVAAFTFADPDTFECSDCPGNSFLIADHKPLSDALGVAVNVTFAVVALGVMVSLLRRWLRATPVQRRTLVAVLFAGGALAVLLFAATTIVPITGRDPTLAGVIGIAALVPFGLVPYVLFGSLLRARVIRGDAFRELVAELGRAQPRQEQLRDALAKALGDPSLELAFWLPDSKEYVDADGKPVDVWEGAPDRAVSEVRLEDRLVAAIVHDYSLLEDPGLVRAVGAAAALALENERLDAELRAKVDELRASRTRILEATLAERRRLERDLHDGAQQRLVSVALSLRLIQDRLKDDGVGARELLSSAGGELDAALDELRELARGIHPAVLSDRGLDAALEALASRAPLPVELDARVRERLPEPVELAAYFVIAEALTNVAKYANASRATVRAVRHDGRLTVEVSDDGVGGADPSNGSGLRGLADRLAALDGTLELRSAGGCGTVLRADIPLPDASGSAD
jgi:signal transduction histidine kinase